MSTVTFSKNTLAILKNFSSLNSNILFKPGKVIKTWTPTKTAMAEATLEESLDVEFGIWDLNDFLGTVSLFDNPSFVFTEKNVKITDGNSVAKIGAAEPRLLSVPTKDVIMPKIDVTINLTQKQLLQLQKAASVMKLPDLSFQTDSGTIVAMVSDMSVPSSNSYRIVVDDKWDGEEFTFNFKMENIKILPSDYVINFARNTVGEFINKNVPLKYWFAMEANTSKYGS